MKSWKKIRIKIQYMQSIIFSSEAIIKVSLRTKKSRKLCALKQFYQECMHFKKVLQVRWFAKLVLHRSCERVEKQTFVNRTLSERKNRMWFRKNKNKKAPQPAYHIHGKCLKIFASCLHKPVITVLHFLVDVITENVDSVDTPAFRTNTPCAYSKVESPDALRQFLL